MNTWRHVKTKLMMSRAQNTRQFVNLTIPIESHQKNNSGIVSELCYIRTQQVWVS